MGRMPKRKKIDRPKPRKNLPRPGKMTSGMVKRKKLPAIKRMGKLPKMKLKPRKKMPKLRKSKGIPRGKRRIVP